MSLKRVWMLSMLLLLLAVSPAWARKWTDSTGRYSIEAELVEVKDGKAWLKKAGGKVVAVPLTKLSHMVLLPFTQLVSELAWHFPPDAGRRVAVALGKEHEPV